MGRSVKDIVEDLRRLKIQEAELLHELLTAQISEIRQTAQERTPSQDATPDIILNRSAVNINQDTQGTTQPFKIGDRVKILNKVRPSFRRQLTTGDTVGTVHRINGDRVHFVTDSGTKSWRVTSNLRKLP